VNPNTQMITSYCGSHPPPPPTPTSLFEARGKMLAPVPPPPPPNISLHSLLSPSPQPPFQKGLVPPPLHQRVSDKLSFSSPLPRIPAGCQVGVFFAKIHATFLCTRAALNLVVAFLSLDELPFLYTTFFIFFFSFFFGLLGRGLSARVSFHPPVFTPAPRNLGPCLTIVSFA